MDGDKGHVVDGPPGLCREAFLVGGVGWLVRIRPSHRMWEHIWDRDSRMCPRVARLLHRSSKARVVEKVRTRTTTSMAREGDAKTRLCGSALREWCVEATSGVARLWRDCGPKAFLVELVMRAFRVFMMNAILTDIAEPSPTARCRCEGDGVSEGRSVRRRPG